VRLITALSLAAVSASAVITGSVDAFQPTVRASAAWIQASAADSNETIAGLVIDNGTMYDVFIVGVQTDVASVEMRERSEGTTTSTVVKEVSVPAYGRLEMSAESVHLRLSALKRPLVAGEAVTLVFYTDGGEQFTVSALVK
jgi:copper(I)-binding protein